MPFQLLVVVVVVTVHDSEIDSSGAPHCPLRGTLHLYADASITLSFSWCAKMSIYWWCSYRYSSLRIRAQRPGSDPRWRSVTRLPARVCLHSPHPPHLFVYFMFILSDNAGTDAIREEEGRGRERSSTGEANRDIIYCCINQTTIIYFKKELTICRKRAWTLSRKKNGRNK